MTLGMLPSQVGNTTYGATCSADPVQQMFEYMCAVEVSTFDGLSAEIGRMRVPEQRYAVFTLDGPLSGLQNLWGSIWKEWLPASGLRPANTPDFERYDERFDPKTRSGIVEIWFHGRRDEVDARASLHLRVACRARVR